MANEKRLIDANALYKKATRAWDDTLCDVCYSEIINLIDEAPTVDAVEVVHGRWIEGGKSNVGDVKGRILHCSECGDYCYNYDPIPPHNYCSNCGAKMDGDGNG